MDATSPIYMRPRAWVTTLLLTLTAMGCAATDGYVEAPLQPYESPVVVEQSLPATMTSALQSCAKERASQLPKHSYEVSFEIQATARGDIQEIVPKGNRLDDTELETCMTNALKELSIREYLRPDDSLVSPPDPQSVSASSRMLLGTAALLPQAIRLAPIVIAAPGGITIVVVVAIVVVAAAVATMSAECQQEWDDAKKECLRQLESNDPDYGVTGGYTNLKDCARGLVGQRCGGNRYDGDGQGARPGRRT